MSEEFTVNAVQSSSTYTRGRAINSARTHHFVIDGSSAPKEEITPVEAFLAGISSCAVHLLENFADEWGVSLQRAIVDIEAQRLKSDPSQFTRIEMHIDLSGPTQEQAAALVERFKGR